MEHVHWNNCCIFKKYRIVLIFYSSTRSWNTSLHKINQILLFITMAILIIKISSITNLRGASGRVNVLVSIPRSLWGHDTLNSNLPIWGIMTIYAENTQKTPLSPEPLDNLGKKNEDFELSESFADAHAGALAKGEAHKRMDWLLKTEDSFAVTQSSSFQLRAQLRNKEARQSSCLVCRLKNLHILFLIWSIFLEETRQGCW